MGLALSSLKAFGLVLVFGLIAWYILQWLGYNKKDVWKTNANIKDENHTKDSYSEYWSD